MRTDPKTNKVERHEGHGVITKVFLSVDLRPQVGVLDGRDTHTVDLPAINPTETGKEKYYGHLSQINEVSDRYNEQIKELAKKGNVDIEALNSAYLGAPVKLETDEANDNAPAPEPRAS